MDHVIGGKFKLWRKIGSGSFGKLYLGIWNSSGILTFLPLFCQLWCFIEDFGMCFRSECTNWRGSCCEAGMHVFLLMRVIECCVGYLLFSASANVFRKLLGTLFLDWFFSRALELGSSYNGCFSRYFKHEFWLIILFLWWNFVCVYANSLVLRLDTCGFQLKGFYLSW